MVRRWFVVASIVLVVAGVAVAVLPFEHPAPIGTYTYGGFTQSTRCSAPLVSAWQSERSTSGWFGYAPLTSRPLRAAESCKGAARERLVATALLEAGGLLVWLLPRRQRGARDARRMAGNL